MIQVYMFQLHRLGLPLQCFRHQGIFLWLILDLLIKINITFWLVMVQEYFSSLLART